jgi:hypothetical protein
MSQLYIAHSAFRKATPMDSKNTAGVAKRLVVLKRIKPASSVLSTSGCSRVAYSYRETMDKPISAIVLA